LVLERKKERRLNIEDRELREDNLRLKVTSQFNAHHGKEKAIRKPEMAAQLAAPLAAQLAEQPAEGGPHRR
jgi:hypothetical protein